VLDLGDTILRIGALDTITYNGVTYDASNKELKYYATDWKFLPGFTFKSGLSYQVQKNATAYVNVGFLNRTPQFSNVIDNNTNSFFGEIVNEKILSAEGGYNYAKEKFGFNVNAYATNWKNKPFPYGVAVPDPNDPTEFIRVNIPRNFQGTSWYLLDNGIGIHLRQCLSLSMIHSNLLSMQRECMLVTLHKPQWPQL
jgi:hypothetical protein